MFSGAMEPFDAYIIAAYGVTAFIIVVVTVMSVYEWRRQTLKKDTNET